MSLIETPEPSLTTETQAGTISGRNRDRRRLVVTYAVSVLGGLALWAVAAAMSGPAFLPSPLATLQALVEMAASGELLTSVWASSRRILVGWGLGVVLGVPLGLLMGRITVIRRLLDPWVEFFRFVPPISFVTIAVIWLGIGEASKVVLIFYTSVFLVTLNTLAGVLAVEPNKLRAAASLGASPAQTLVQVVLPSTVPHIVTGARLAMGNSFLTIVSAEIVAAQEGLGAIIWQSRNIGRVDNVFVGILTLGILGFIFDRLLRIAATRFLGRFGVKL